MSRQKAILIVGPTGAGKTPLGDAIQATGLWGRTCHHFDFGEHLRAAVDGRHLVGITQEEAVFIRDLLHQGALLENSTFYLAEKILNGFVTERNIAHGDLIVLNGLPRHVGQSMSIDPILNIIAVVSLNCTANTVYQRLAGNSGGDRTNRTDDDLSLVTEKLRIFKERTKPLVAHYRQYGSMIVELEVGVATQPAELVGQIPKL